MNPAHFKTNIIAIPEKDYDKYNISKASMMQEAQASSLIPDSFQGYKNIDILPVLLSIAVVNKFNENDDAITPLSAAKMLPLFAHKPINIEHNKEMIVGHMVDASFADWEPSFSKNDTLDYLNRTDGFYIAGAGFIYKSIFPKLAEAISLASDPYEDTYNAYAGSWEVAFNNYDIAVGNGDSVSEIQVVTSDEPNFQALDSTLKANKGSGVGHDGLKVRRILRGDKVPVGLALTENPAANVTGIYALASISDEKISEKEKIDVTDNETNVAMDEKQFKEFKELLTSFAAKEDPTTPAQEIFEKLNVLLEEKGQDWKSKSDQNAEDLADAKANLAKVEKDLEDATSKIDQFQNDISVRDAADKLNDRMAAIASAFELEEAEEAIVAKEVSKLPADDKEFEEYLTKTKVIFAHRDKEAIANKKKEEEEVKEAKEPKESVASKAEEKKEEEINSLETLEAKASPFLNNVGEDAEGKSLMQRLQSTGLVLED